MVFWPMIPHYLSPWILKGILGVLCGPRFPLASKPSYMNFISAKPEISLVDRLVVGSGGYNPPYENRIWLWVYHNKIPRYPILSLLKGDYKN